MKKHLLVLLILIGITIKLYIHINRVEHKVIPIKIIKLQPVKLKYQRYNFDTIIKRLIIIETNGNNNLIGDNGTAIGLLQIRPICVNDINRIYHTKFKHKEALDSLKAIQMCKLYLKYGIKLYKKKHNKYPTEKEIVKMWNGGIYKGYEYVSTEKYYQKYLNLINSQK